MSSRDEMFANFQACTGIEDVEHCIAVLEQNDWDLNKAIVSVFDNPGHQDIQLDANSEENQIVNESLNIVGDKIAIASVGQNENILNEDIPMNDIATSPINLSPSNRKRIRMVEFDVEWRGQIYPVVLPDTDKIDTIKTCLALQLSLDASNLKLHGFKVPCADWTIIRDMHLPKENRITMTVVGEDGKASTASTSASISNLNQNPTADDNCMTDIHVKDMRNHKIYPLKQPHTRTFGQLKQDLFGLTNIPTSRQLWSGVLSHADHDSFLKDCGLTKELNYFELRDSLMIDSNSPSSSNVDMNTDRQKDNERNTKGDPQTSKDHADNFMSYDEDDSYDYPIYYEDDLENIRHTAQQLMPENVENESLSVENFRCVFRDRYAGDSGLIIPFFVGTLDQAVQTMTDTPIHQRKPIFLYLHHDRSVLANIFCSQVLCSCELVHFFIENDYLLWPWDLTQTNNKSKLIVSLTKHLGSVEANRINRMSVDSLPVILMLSNLEYGHIQIFEIISGSCTVKEIMERLSILKNHYSELQAPHMSQAIEREQREQFRREQYEAYLESLRLDQERDRQRELENNREEEHRKKVQFEEKAREARFLEAKSRIPDEPGEVADRFSMACIRFRLPNGEQKMRRFSASHTLQNLIDYVESLGFPREEIKIITTYPRKDLAVLEDVTLTMSDLKLVPQETLTLETK